MTYSEFNDWCNERACDGFWGKNEAVICIEIIRQVHKQPFWKRKNAWNEYRNIAEKIVNATNEKINEILGETDETDR